MRRLNRMPLVFRPVFLLLLVLLIVSAASPASTAPGSFFIAFDPESGFPLIDLPAFEEVDEVVKRYREGFGYSGEVDHQHRFNFAGGTAEFVASGFGDLVGSQEILTIETLEGYRTNLKETYRASTDIVSAVDSYLDMVSTLMIAGKNAVEIDIATNPGGASFINQTVASAKEEDQSYLRHITSAGSSDAVTKLTTDISRVRSTVEVEGFAVVREKVGVEEGRTKTGWWDLKFPTEEEEEEEEE